MRAPSLSRPRRAGVAWALSLWHLFTYISRPTQAITFTPVSPPNLNLEDLGRVALTGDFDAVSLFSYREQAETPYNTNGSQAVIVQQPNGDFSTSQVADGYIKSMCPFVMQNGELAGVIMGGNFTSMGGQEAQGVAMFDPKSQKITPLPGLTGQVEVVWCDKDSNTVYVGGDFKGANSTNAIAWVGTSGWANLPFAGFDGPVNSIVTGPNGTIVFGGSFTGLGNTTLPDKADQQVINLSSANISTIANSSTPGFGDPRNIICKTSGQDGPGNTWLLEDNAPGQWRADFNLGFEPSKLRLWNTHQDGRGSKTFAFTAYPLNGIMNFSYVDPATGQSANCDALCPLSNDPKVPFQDFKFVNQVGMSAFSINISAWYGNGGGLAGIELFQNDTYAYAESDLNEPACANLEFPSNATHTGPWTVTPSGKSNSRYLTADLTGPNAQSDGVSIVFQPDIKQSGNYSVTIYTPGCDQDDSCDTRGIVNVTGTFAADSSKSSPTPVILYQTNEFDKYDQVYYGPVDASSGSFRPSVTLTPASNQKRGFKIVAQRVRFQVTNTTGGLNGLYEFDPNQATLNTDYTNSTVDSTGMNLDPGAEVNSLIVLDSGVFVGGNFSGPGVRNVMSITKGNGTGLGGGGLNAQVSKMLAFEDLLFIGGNFTNTVQGNAIGLNNIAVYNSTSKGFQAMGMGVNGRVNSIAALILNITLNTPETCIAFTGNFDQINGFDGNPDLPASGFGVWVPSRGDWQRNLLSQSMAINGQISASTNVTGSTPLYAGTITSQDINAADAIALTSGPLRINSLGVRIVPEQSSDPRKRKRAIESASTQNFRGAIAGLFYNDAGQNITILGGHLSATSSNNSKIENLVFLNSSGTITGLPSGIDDNSTFMALDSLGSALYAGGTVTGNVNNAAVNGLILFDLVQDNYAFPQPPPLGGDNVSVNAITTRPKSQQVYVGGNFDTAGSLGCPGLCMYENGQWSQPGSGFTGVVSTLAWQGSTKLLAGGNLTIAGNATSLAIYDTKKSQWSVVDGSAANVPGPVTALTMSNNEGSQYWVGGASANGSAFLVKYDGSVFHSIGDVFAPGTVIRGLSVFTLNNKHSHSDLVEQDQSLLVTGLLDLPGFGNASAALYNGTTFTPFLLTTSKNQPGSISQLFSEKPMKFSKQSGHMAIGFIVLIALACALGAIFLLVIAGILIERYRRRKEGYTPAPTAYIDKTTNMGRVPPEQLFGNIGRGSGGEGPRL